MVVDATYRIGAFTKALRPFLEGLIRQGGDAFVLDLLDDVGSTLELTAQRKAYAVISEGPTSRDRYFGGVSTVEVPYVLTAVGDSPQMVRMVRDRLRVALVGEDRLGVPEHDIELAGLRVIARELRPDGAMDVVSGLCQWTETVALRLVPHEAP